MWCKQSWTIGGGIITCLNLLATCLVIESRMLLANLVAREVLCASSPRALPAELLPQAPVLSLYPCQGLFLPGSRLGICPCRASSGSQYSNSSCFLGIPDYQSILPLSISPGHPPSTVSPENTIRLHHIACTTFLAPVTDKGRTHIDTCQTLHSVWALNHHTLTQIMQLVFYSPSCPQINSNSLAWCAYQKC